MDDVGAGDADEEMMEEVAEAAEAEAEEEDDDDEAAFPRPSWTTIRGRTTRSMRRRRWRRCWRAAAGSTRAARWR